MAQWERQAAEKGLQKILASTAFARATRHRELLQYIVTKSLTGRSEDLKEYVIALDVFQRDATYDPKLDSTVRVEVSKLRARLQKYYETEGREDDVRIEIPKGGYVAAFAGVPTAEPPLVPVAARQTPPPAASTRRLWLGGAVGVSLAALAGGAAFYLRRPPAPTGALAWLHVPEAAPRGGASPGANALLQTLTRALEKGGVPSVTAADGLTGTGTSIAAHVYVGRCWNQPGQLQLVAELADHSVGQILWSQLWQAGVSDRELAGKALDALLQAIRKHVPPVASVERQRALEPYRQALDSLPRGVDYLLLSTADQSEPAPLQSLLRTSDLLREALRLDPLFAAAHAKLAWICHLASEYDARMAPAAREAALRALELDPDSSDANFVRGYLDMLAEWNFPSAERFLKTCLNRAVLHVTANRLYADVLSIRGRVPEALRQLSPSLSVRPRSQVLRVSAFWLASVSRDLTEMDRIARETMEILPAHSLSHWMVGTAFGQAGRFREGEAEFRKILAKDARHGKALTGLAHLFATEGRFADALKLVESAGGERRWPALISLTHAAAGNLRQAVGWMERAVDQRDPNVPYALVSPFFAPLRGEAVGRKLIDQFQAKPARG